MRMRVPYIIINYFWRRVMSKQEPITKAKLALIQKILNARLSQAELREVTAKAKDIINARKK